MLVFPTYQKLITSKGLPDTVTQSGVYSTSSNSTSLNSVFSVNLTNVTTVPRAGKRLSLIHLSYRLTGTDAFSAYDDWFKPSGQGGSATFTLGGVTPTYRTRGNTTANGTAIYTLGHDLNTSGSNATVALSWNNSSYDTSGLSSFSAPGGYGVTVWIFDYVESYSIAWAGYQNNSNISAMNGFNTAPPSASNTTASHKAITGFSTNSNALNWDPADGSTYTTTNDTDIGTNEMIETSYAFEATASPSNLQGDMDVSSGSASGGVTAALSFLRFIPSTS